MTRRASRNGSKGNHADAKLRLRGFEAVDVRGEKRHQGAMASLHAMPGGLLAKYPLAGTPHDPLNREVLATEAAALALCSHPGVVPFRGMDGGALIIDALEGPDLRMTVRRPMPIVRAVRILADILDALSHIHRRGLVHGDLKPENIVMHQGRAVLVDLANARAPQGGQRMGSPPYCPPEQLDKGAKCEPRDDVFAAARILEFLGLGATPARNVDAEWLAALPLWIGAWVVEATHPSRLRRPSGAEEALRRLPPTRMGVGPGGWHLEGGLGDQFRLPIRIGRAEGNHVRVDADHVSRYHLSLCVSESGRPYLLQHGARGHRLPRRLFRGDSIDVGGLHIGRLQSASG